MINNLESIMNWEEVKMRLFVKATNRHKEADSAATVKLTNDICLRVSVLLSEAEACESEIATASMPWKTLEYISGGMDRQEILRLAIDNTFDLFTPVCTRMPRDISDMGSFIDELKFIEFMKEPITARDDKETFVVTNRFQVNGATSIFLPGVVKRLSEVFDSDLLIAFTSIHEAMVHSMKSGLSPGDLEQILTEPAFNSDDIYLSSKAYIYDRDYNEIHEFIKGDSEDYYGEKVVWNMFIPQTTVCYRQ